MVIAASRLNKIGLPLFLLNQRAICNIMGSHNKTLPEGETHMRRCLLIAVLLLFSVLFASCRQSEATAGNTQDTYLSLEEELALVNNEASPAVSPGAAVSPLEPESVPETPVPEESPDASSPIYYEYNGVYLPPDIITPIYFTYITNVGDDLPFVIFDLKGATIQRYGLTSDRKMYYINSVSNHVTSIIVSSGDSSFSQELTGFETSTPDIPNFPYGFSLDDWNFDGYRDISLWKYEGGTSLNAPTFYWLWDREKNEYDANKELEELSENNTLGIDEDNQYVTASHKLPGGFYDGYYIWKGETLLLVKTIEVSFIKSPEDPDTMIAHMTIKELQNGELVITSEYDEPAE
jgi:hypothetical protein